MHSMDRQCMPLYIRFVFVVQNATEELERLGYAFDAVKKQLLGRLHDLARKQIGFDTAPAKGISSSLLVAQTASNGSGSKSNRSREEASHTGMPEMTDAVSATFTDQ